MAPAFPARVHVLLASQAPFGLVIRRGPAKQVATLLWDRRTDTFQLGQWLKGRVYERRCDLSPDGRSIIYFAMNGRWESESRGAWTAISRAPYLKAIAMFPKGDCWQGGGLWTGSDTYWLNGPHDVLHDKSGFRSDGKGPSPGFGGECLSVYYPRLLRDGWCLQQRSPGRDIFTKSVGKGWTLVKTACSALDPPTGSGHYWDEHQLVNTASGRDLECPEWEWAELDGDRLVWAAGGKMLAGTVTSDGVIGASTLHDFNDMLFEAHAAPY